MSSHPSEHFQVISETRFRILAEVQLRPDLPLAMHEAGHAFLYEFNDISVMRCLLRGEPAIDGITELVRQTPITKYNFWPVIVSIMAGAAAQHVIDERGAVNNATADMRRASEYMDLVGLNQKQTDELIVEAAKAAATIIMKNIGTVVNIADVLERKKRVEGDEIRQIIQEHKHTADR
jgi:hypothetical protein